jgi:hypothetical protein
MQALEFSDSPGTIFMAVLELLELWNGIQEFRSWDCIVAGFCIVCFRNQNGRNSRCGH